MHLDGSGRQPRMSSPCYHTVRGLHFRMTPGNPCSWEEPGFLWRRGSAVYGRVVVSTAASRIINSLHAREKIVLTSQKEGAGEQVSRRLSSSTCYADHNSVGGAAADLSAVKANLTERLQARDQLLYSVTEERDGLKANLTEKTREVDRLQSLSRRKLVLQDGGWSVVSVISSLRRKLLGNKADKTAEPEEQIW
ncbi:uncharacterized protein LOC117487626 isoform X5 [Trematomus bernacchii]|uniref:uncharacterized protein LOC117487626 isoform X5 n=1 Tax=Trematomus bernacchii TaxID=40690 RepID=UPI00146BEC2A|nr:uncharacterized protein LOC117487626 isoform X5 [Trematomus bernacchii]